MTVTGETSTVIVVVHKDAKGVTARPIIVIVGRVSVVVVVHTYTLEDTARPRIVTTGKPTVVFAVEMDDITAWDGCSQITVASRAFTVNFSKIIVEYLAVSPARISRREELKSRERAVDAE